ncbi:hypothetical protein QPK31_20295 [Massilia sp. YIM B02769]|uniref:hypothetical protein n=1 Tax=unclassified Massilia TaxID=2609279 RepID=UPI0025B68C07|nr:MULTISPECIES: hypothetical protein [unclassified Massilia]MDN4060555.1 hypothetical protein [Massilia sp. YIM B02769]
MKHMQGQASSEYLLVLALCVVVLVMSALGPSPVQEVIQAIKDYFAAYSYAISVTP